ncbi:XisH family protein [Gloeothece verrucosa]|uniref:XisH protein n=1 Tax=Gloeothece verrucosa (strain PCC 7822) TaxID=497965 RepID=E0UJW1_GLOV7|nr:XisH family protein [Gloeothece verrucosa]ADN13472.1 XisH protein [Gloeothece verrucosa PCC 7822]
MPAKDLFHNVVKNALIKDGWIITDDPLYLTFGGVDMYVDLGAEKLIAAEKDHQKIAVEVKSFMQASITAEYHTALGQYINYRMILENKEPDRILYLAVSEDAYATFFRLLFTQVSIKKNGVKLVIYDIKKEEVREWIN